MEAFTLGASQINAIIFGIHISAYAKSIKLITTPTEVIAAKVMVAM